MTLRLIKSIQHFIDRPERKKNEQFITIAAKILIDKPRSNKTMAQWESRRVHFLRRTRRYICVRFRRQLSEDIYCYEILKNNNGTYMYTNMYSKRLIDLIHVLFASSRQHVYTMINDCTMLYKLEIIRIHTKMVIFLFFSTKKIHVPSLEGKKIQFFLDV